ncbi:mCG1038782, partial [Mus musculus]
KVECSIPSHSVICDRAGEHSVPLACLLAEATLGLTRICSPPWRILWEIITNSKRSRCSS